VAADTEMPKPIKRPRLLAARFVLLMRVGCSGEAGTVVWRRTAKAVLEELSPIAATAIRLDQITKTFPGSSTPAVDALSLDIDEGSIVALIGPSGCGKTTTLRMINRLIEPTSGSIEIAGRDVTHEPVAELRRGIGYVIQQVGLFPHRTIAQNIATVPKTLGWDKQRIAARIDELADLVGLDPEMLDRYPDELSGGQQQRVGVARALAADPPILLMDEPFGAVDPIVRTKLQDELLGLQQRLSKTIVLVTHDIDEALKLADRIALLNVGGILEQYAGPDDLLRAPANAFVEQFVGEDRGVKRLQLSLVESLPYLRGPVVDVTASVDEARRAIGEHGGTWVGLLRDDGFIGWVHADQLDGAGSLAAAAIVPPVGRVTPRSTLRSAVEVIMRSNTSVAVIEDEDGRFGGVVTLEHIRAALGLADEVAVAPDAAPEPPGQS
jgi:osmoprotectant transport system ATP-binding protein